MSGRFVRASKYRHVHGAIAKKEKAFLNVRSACSGEGNYICANTKYWATASPGGGGPVLICPQSRVGRLDHNIPKLNVHKAAVVDMAFSPFIDNLLATGGEDAYLKLTVLPEDGSFDKLESSNVTLEGHTKKLAMIHFHPTASNVIGSIAFDNTCKIWDVEHSKEFINFDDHTDLPQSFEWNDTGSLIATACKDKLIRILDPRVKSSVIKSPSEGAGKGARIVWFDNQNLLGCVGFSKTNSRQIILYDPKKFDAPLATTDMDTSASVPIPFYDSDTGVLFIAGKGDATIHYYEVVKEEPYVHFLSDFRDTESTKGCCFLPKSVVDTKCCEIDICYRVMKDWVSPVSFQVPRKQEQFQSDLYPDTYAGVPSMTAEEYMSGQNKPVIKKSMKPGASVVATPSTTPFNAAPLSKPNSEVQRELDLANQRIKELEEEVAKLKAK